MLSFEACFFQETKESGRGVFKGFETKMESNENVSASSKIIFFIVVFYLVVNSEIGVFV